MDMKHCKFLNRLRQKYVGNEDAYDTLMLVALQDGDPNVDVPARVKRALAFCATAEGEALYQQVCDLPKPKKRNEIYDYSHEMAKAAQHKDGAALVSQMSLNKGMLRPEHAVMESLSRFRKTISS